MEFSVGTGGFGGLPFLVDDPPEAVEAAVRATRAVGQIETVVNVRVRLLDDRAGADLGQSADVGSAWRKGASIWRNWDF